MGHVNVLDLPEMSHPVLQHATGQASHVHLVTGGDDQSIGIAHLLLQWTQSGISVSVVASQIISNAHASAVKVGRSGQY